MRRHQKAALAEERRVRGQCVFPKRLFSQASAEEQLRVRIDDKLSRLLNQGPKAIVEDTELDLIGYLILLRVAKKLHVT